MPDIDRDDVAKFIPPIINFVQPLLGLLVTLVQEVSKERELRREAERERDQERELRFETETERDQLGGEVQRLFEETMRLEARLP